MPEVRNALAARFNPTSAFIFENLFFHPATMDQVAPILGCDSGIKKKQRKTCHRKERAHTTKLLPAPSYREGKQKKLTPSPTSLSPPPFSSTSPLLKKKKKDAEPDVVLVPPIFERDFRGRSRMAKSGYHYQFGRPALKWLFHD